MRYIGIITAMDEELVAIKSLMNEISVKRVYNLEFICGKISHKNIVLVKSGIGKVNGARTTQVLIDNFKLDYVINVGTAGGLTEKIEIGDIVIGGKLIQHDFDITAGGHEKGYISDIGKYFYSNDKLIEKAKDTIKQMEVKSNYIIGTIATGDTFVQNIDMKESIKNDLNADCAEMEGAAIAQVCTLCNIPFIVIRSISDKPNGNNNIDFKTYLHMACERYAKFIDILIK